MKNRKGFTSFLLLVLVFFTLGGFLYYYLQNYSLNNYQEREQRIKDWKKSVYDYFNKTYPELTCSCTIKKGKKREEIDFLEVSEIVINTCEEAAKKYPEDAFAIRSACMEWITSHFDGLDTLKRYPKILEEWQKKRELELKELRDRFTKIEFLIKKYGLISALTLTFLISVLLALAFNLHKKLSAYLEVKNEIDGKIAQARQEAESILRNAEKEKNRVLLQAKQEAQSVINEAKKQAERITDQAKQYGEVLKKEALKEVGEEIEKLREENESLKTELSKLKSNFNNPAYLASYVTEDDDRLYKFIKALITQRTAERVQKELRKALRKKSG